MQVYTIIRTDVLPSGHTNNQLLWSCLSFSDAETYYYNLLEQMERYNKVDIHPYPKKHTALYNYKVISEKGLVCYMQLHKTEITI